MRNARTSRSGLSSVVRLWVLCALCGGAVVVSVCLAADKPSAAPAGAASPPGPGSLVPGPSSSPAPGSPPGPSSPLPVASSQPLDANDPDVKLLVKGLNEFAIDLYKEIAKTEKGNIFFSPFSISSALAMTYAGARGKTAEEMAKVLHFPPELTKDNGKRLHAAVSLLTRNAQAKGTELAKQDSFILTVANALWVQKGMRLREDFLQVTRRAYEAGLAEVDFRGAPGKATEIINRWVEKETNRKIQDILPPGLVTSNTPMVLTNAIYFKGTWLDQFKPYLTSDAPFMVGGKKPTKVPTMMKESDEFLYAEEESFRTLVLPYLGGRASMVVLLPRANDGIEELGKRLDAAAIDKTARKARRDGLAVWLPKYKTTWAKDLMDNLGGLGLVHVDDFSGITDETGLSLAFVLHKAFVDVNEEGTEAAAATAVGLNESANRMEFRVDHPFLYIIRDNATGLIYFFGRTMDPIEGGK